MGGGGFAFHAGVWGGVLCKVFILASIMHGVAGDNHRRSHGDGSAPHGELVGDGIVGTAAAGARLTSGGSWGEIGERLVTPVTPVTAAERTGFHCRDLP